MAPNPAALQTITPAEVRFWIGQTEGMVSTLVEAGLGSTPDQRAEIERCNELIAEARRRAAADDLIGAASAMVSADLVLHTAYAHQSLVWRLRRHAPLEFLYLAGVLFVVLVGSGSWRPGVLSWMPLAEPEIWGVPTKVLAWGALGAVARSLYWLHKQVGRRMYRGHFGLTHYCAPLIGAIFGALAYLLLSAGLFTLGGGGGGGGAGASGALPSAVALLFGFQWEPLLDWIDRVRLPGRPATREGGATAEEPAGAGGEQASDAAGGGAVEEPSDDARASAAPGAGGSESDVTADSSVGEGRGVEEQKKKGQ